MLDDKANEQISNVINLNNLEIFGIDPDVKSKNVEIGEDAEMMKNGINEFDDTENEQISYVTILNDSEKCSIYPDVTPTNIETDDDVEMTHNRTNPFDNTANEHISNVINLNDSENFGIYPDVAPANKETAESGIYLITPAGVLNPAGVLITPVFSEVYTPRFFSNLHPQWGY